MGIWDVGSMLSAMKWSELAAWRSYAELEPFGEDRQDLRAGTIASVMANVHLKEGRTPFRPSDFFPNLVGPPSTGGNKPLTDQTEWKKLKEAFKQTGKPLE